MRKLYFHLFAGISLVGMTLWIIKDLWWVILLLAVPTYFLRRKKDRT